MKSSYFDRIRFTSTNMSKSYLIFKQKCKGNNNQLFLEQTHEATYKFQLCPACLVSLSLGLTQLELCLFFVA